MKQKELFLLSLTIFFTIIAWLLVDVYKAKEGTLKTPNIRNQTTYTIDTQVFQKLKQKNL